MRICTDCSRAQSKKVITVAKKFKVKLDNQAKNNLQSQENKTLKMVIDDGAKNVFNGSNCLACTKPKVQPQKKYNNNNKAFDETGRKLSHPKLAEAEFG